VRKLALRSASFLAMVVTLIAPAASAAAQVPLTPGMVVGLRGTPHLWFADERGVLHWGGDTRALTGKTIAWDRRIDVSVDDLRRLPLGDPWLSLGLFKDGDPIYLVKWETDEAAPRLLHIQSIADVELFGINGSNYGNLVLDRSAWESRFSMSSAGLTRGSLTAAVAVASPAPAPAPVAAAQAATTRRNYEPDCQALVNNLPSRPRNLVLQPSNAVLNCIAFADFYGAKGLECYDRVVRRQIEDAIVYSGADYSSRVARCVSGAPV
jgi:hypothetical protein